MFSWLNGKMAVFSAAVNVVFVSPRLCALAHFFIHDGTSSVSHVDCPMLPLFHILLPQADQILKKAAADSVFAAANSLIERVGSKCAELSLVSRLYCSTDSKVALTAACT